MKLTIINSTAPGTAALLSPFFDAVAASAGVELTVLEHVPVSQSRRGYCNGTRLVEAPQRYRLQGVPTHFYNRRHACAQIMARRFREMLREADPELIYILGEPGYLSTYQVVRFARRQLRNARICLLAAQNVYQRFPPPFPAIERWVLARIDHVFPIGPDHENVLRRKGYSGPATHLPLGVDTDFFSPDQADPSRVHVQLPPPIVGYVGDFLPARDLPLLMAAVHGCRAHPSLLLVGDGPTRGDLECLARSKGLERRVAFAGRVPHERVRDYMAHMDALVLPSRGILNHCFGVFRIANAEQFGRVLVEAMACGKPVVGSSCGEIPAVIGEAGRVYPEGDGAALTAVLEELCCDEPLRERLGETAAARARWHYDWRVIARQLLEVLEGMLTPTRADRRAAPEVRKPAPTAAR